MDIRNCIKCRKVFTYVNSPYCPTCIKEEDELFETVRLYIKDNPSCTMLEVVDATGISLKKIMRYLKEGRLELSQGMQGELECELCGKPVKKGKFCDACAIKISQDMSVLFSSKPKKSGAEIYHRHN